ncbi:CobW family GTP-binding protein [Pseudoponticoccus marisrubri]|uniref:Cobalamin biosynthesis protein P47K n=1 Tax=Pseudoponticoccus marisrubri TaxID=1685382 RepID=A0A0W7WLB9_9RHOB|nr:GTP-binding protein [Pseudoponticoccus marisrubri]KUF11405.1 cobalamin biosynthesis protein P47K [Pseudoponticoccus marisrubri]
MNTADPRLPVTLLTGFLGAGKTTLLNALLSDGAAGRIAVIVNEFGEAGLDHDLIEHVGEEVVLMQSGCLCCSVRGDLSRTMADLLARREDGALAFDRVVIETTGLADPGPILQTLLVDPFLARRTRMDGIVTVADAANGPATLDAQFEAVSQVAMADLVVLSKTDLVQPDRVVMFEERLRAINPDIRILHAVRGAGIAGQVWGLSGLRQGAAAADVLAWTRAPEPAADPLANLSGLARATPPAQTLSPHDSRIGTASVILDDPVPDAVFDLWLDTLIALRGPDILRVKGIVFLEGIETPFVFHGVQHVFDPPVPLQDWPGGDRRTRIVVIARDITRPALQRNLDLLRARLPGAQDPALEQKAELS